MKTVFARGNVYVTGDENEPNRYCVWVGGSTCPSQTNMNRQQAIDYVNNVLDNPKLYRYV